MKDGNLWKEKLEYTKERFSTKEGLVGFGLIFTGVGLAISYAIIRVFKGITT